MTQMQMMSFEVGEYKYLDIFHIVIKRLFVNLNPEKIIERLGRGEFQKTRNRARKRIVHCDYPWTPKIWHNLLVNILFLY